MKYPDVSEVLRGDVLAREDDTWIRLIHEKQHLAKLISFLQPKSILELGSGTGIYAGMLAKQFPGVYYVGVDANPEAISIARRRNPDLYFKQDDVRTVTFSNRRFDLVCAHAFLKHFSFDDWMNIFPRFLSLGEHAQFDMQTTSGDTFNDGSASFGNNLWVNRTLFDQSVFDFGHKILSEEIAYEHDSRRATIFLTSRV